MAGGPFPPTGPPVSSRYPTDGPDPSPAPGSPPAGGGPSLRSPEPSRERLRVVHLGKYYPPSPGGIEGHTRTLAQAQAELGADVRVVVVNHAAAGGRDATFD